jgi:hypothetical protein
MKTVFSTDAMTELPRMKGNDSRRARTVHPAACAQDDKSGELSAVRKSRSLASLVMTNRKKKQVLRLRRQGRLRSG